MGSPTSEPGLPPKVSPCRKESRSERKKSVNWPNQKDEWSHRPAQQPRHQWIPPSRRESGSERRVCVSWKDSAKERERYPPNPNPNPPTIVEAAV
jgi:hypothetical protein